ncbi:MAG TPA: hypothetical protein VFQ35_25555 [Polyangiaceae bacterium]|nr:hypothetical protein [Polyangiaceae bacterium]
MSDDDREVMALLAAARRVGPPAHTKDRLRARVLAGVTSGAALSSATVAAKGAAVAAASGSAIASKAVIALVVGVALGLGGSVIASSVASSPAAVKRMATQTIVSAPKPVTSARPVEKTEVAAPKEATAVPSALPSAEPKRAAAPLHTPSIDDETRLIASAHRALASGRANDALAALNRYRQEFPNGALLEEATGARVLALCAAGRKAEGEAARASFLRAFPNSPLSTRVGSACVTP